MKAEYRSCAREKDAVARCETACPAGHGRFEEEKHEGSCGDMTSRAAGAAGGIPVISLRELSVGARAHVDVCGRD